MDIDIRKAVKKNLEGRSRTEIRGYIEDAIESQNEAAIPGMGVLFEEIWEKGDESRKQKIMDWVIPSLTVGGDF
jgi:small acid-soluble spore protein I (minor)